MKEKLDAWLHIKKGGLNNFGYNDNYKAIVKSTSHVYLFIHADANPMITATVVTTVYTLS